MSEIKKYMNGKTLKFCPCCNGIAVLDEPEVQIRCIDCGLTMDITKCFSIGGSWKEAVEEAVAKWNTRKPMERIAERVHDITKVYLDARNPEESAYVVRKMDVINILKEEGGIE